MNLETPFWKGRAAFWMASALLALAIFFANTDFAWRPHQSLPLALLLATLGPLVLLAGAAVAWIIGRIFRVPLEWKFLVRLEVWITLLSAPIYGLNIIGERVFSLQQTERSFATFASGILITLWAFQIWRRYRARVSPHLLGVFCAVYALVSAGFVISEQRAPASQVMGTHPWKWQNHGRIHLAYTDDMRDAELAREDARRTSEMLNRIEKKLGTRVSARQINVFLFPDEESLNEFAAEELAGVAGEGGVLLVGYEWEWMRGTLVHELSHFVVASAFGPDVRALADEGTSVWMERTLAPGEDNLIPRRHKEIASASLAQNETFHGEYQERVLKHYEQAGWLAKTTIEKHGFPKWRQFLSVCKSGLIDNYFETPETASAEVKAQYQEIFGEPMP